MPLMLNQPRYFSASHDDVARCRALVAEIDALARQTGAYEAERQWTAPAGNPVYPSPLRPEDVTPAFLAELPSRSPFFTGWPPNGATLNRLGTAIWAILSPLSPVLGARVITRWWHRLQREPCYYGGPPKNVAKVLADWYETHLPPNLRPRADFDGTELDRLALCERLTAMRRLEVISSLGSIDCPVVLEIGAGYGALAAMLRQMFPELIYLIVDLPSSLARAGCYLATRQAGRVSVIGPEVVLTPGDIGLVVNTALSAVEGQPIDLAINTLSFGEMSSAVVESYAAFLSRNLTADGMLFEQNFDNTHIEGENFCDPSAALSRHLKRSANCAGGYYMKGTPRLWVAPR